jgi:molybdopterin/thiamine biosynthesis adenylyltransferase
MPQTLSTADRTRYSRHLLIPEVGEAGQARLSTARVLVVGAGGLGCPSALYLAAAGVGHITIVDHDRVDRSNLQRQVLHTDDRIGMPKVESARRSLEALNPSVEVNALEVKIDDGNADELLAEYDVVVDGCDNFKTRYTVNDACVRLGKINIHGSIHRFEGQVSVFWPGRGPCYRCLHPQAPPADLSPNCAEAGVLGVLPGVIGMLEATETLKILLDLGEPLVGRLLTYDALAARFTEFRLSRDSDCPACGDLQPR